MAPYSIDELRRIIAPIAIAHGVESVSVFGSYSRGSASADSDVDLKLEHDIPALDIACEDILEQ